MVKHQKTLVLGASPNPARYAYTAVVRLSQLGYEVIPFGIREGDIQGIPIVMERQLFKALHTVTIYLNPIIQRSYYDYLLELKPSRIIFNPGSENHELAKLARDAEIEVENACTLVMLSTGVY